MGCLLGMGPVANVMNWLMFQKLQDSVLKEIHDRLQCANDSLLNIRAKTTVEVELDDKKRHISYYGTKYGTQRDWMH